MAKILVVDPLEDRLYLVRRHLEADGHEVSEALDVVRGLELVREMKPELTLLANNQNVLQAADFLQVRAQLGELALSPIIVYSVHRSAMFNLFHLGSDDIVVEPLDLTELGLRVAAVLRRSQLGGVRGSLSHFPFIELVQMIFAGRLSGILQVDCPNLRGKLIVNKGQIINAECEGGVGEDAVLQLLQEGQNGGFFYYAAMDTSKVENNVLKHTDHLLLDLANMLDESGDVS